MNAYQHLYTAEDTAIVFIDHQPQMTFGVSSIDRQILTNNVTLLAEGAREYGVPTILTAVETEDFSGHLWPQLRDVFEDQRVLKRTSMNPWDDTAFRAAIEATGRENILLTGLWTEVCVTWPAIEMLREEYNVYVIEDCCGATSVTAHEAALSRIEQAGAVRLTTIAALLEWQRDWTNQEHSEFLRKILNQHAGSCGVGAMNPHPVIHNSSQTTKAPQMENSTPGIN